MSHLSLVKPAFRVCFFSGNLIGKATDLKKVPTDLDEKQHKTSLKKDGGSDYRVEKTNFPENYIGLG